MYERTYGKRYEKELSTVQIAAIVRKRIKELVKTEALPSGKYSVRSRYFAGGSSIDVRIKRFDVPLLNIDWVLNRLRDPNWWQVSEATLPRYTKEAREALALLKAILAEYNFDGSEMMVDYFDVNFYGHVDVDSAYETEIFDKLTA